LRKEIYSTILVKEKREETFSCLRLSKRNPPLKRKSAFPGRFGENVENVPFYPFSKSRGSVLKKLEPERHMLLCGHDLN
jgi:hypothetical protein